MHSVIYIPGLGDHNINSQQRVFGWWRIWGVEPILLQMNWADKQPFEPKLQQIIDTIDRLEKEGNSVSIVAASAGASAALAAFAARKDAVHKVALLCGEVKVGAQIKSSYRQQNPAFVESMDMLGNTLAQLGDNERTRIRSYHPIFDETVPVEDTKIEGVTNKLLFIVGHPFGIGYGLILSAPFISRWFKR